MTANLAIAASAAFASVMVARPDMTRAVEIASMATEKRNTYPILANLLLRGDGNTLFVMGTDLDIEMCVAVPAPADAAFDVTIPAHLLKDILKKAPKAEFVAFSRTAESKTRAGEDGEPEAYLDWSPTVLADFERSKYNLSALDSGNWPTMFGPGFVKDPTHADPYKAAPVIYDAKAATRFTMSGKQLFDLLDATQFAISKEETRYYLNGIFLHAYLDGNRYTLRTVATDGHRMARYEVDLPDGATAMPGVIVPSKTVALMLKLMKGKTCPESVAIELDERKIRFHFDNVTVTSKLVEGTFPDYQRVTPMHNDKVAVFDIAAMEEALDAVSLIASERGGKAVKLVVENGATTLSCVNPDNGTAEMTIGMVESFEGYIEIGFNARYLGDMLDELKPHGKTVTLKLNDCGSPTLFLGERDGWMGVLMPMRV